MKEEFKRLLNNGSLFLNHEDGVEDDGGKLSIEKLEINTSAYYFTLDDLKLFLSLDGETLADAVNETFKEELKEYEDLSKDISISSIAFVCQKDESLNSISYYFAIEITILDKTNDRNIIMYFRSFCNYAQYRIYRSFFIDELSKLEVKNYYKVYDEAYFKSRIEEINNLVLEFINFDNYLLITNEDNYFNLIEDIGLYPVSNKSKNAAHMYEISSGKNGYIPILILREDDIKAFWEYKKNTLSVEDYSILSLSMLTRR